MKRTLSFTVLFLLFGGCASMVQQRQVVKGQVQNTVIRTGIMLKKMGEKPTLSMISSTNFLITSPLATIQVEALSTNSSSILIQCRDRYRARALASFIKQTDPTAPPLLPKEEGRSLIGLFSLHFLSPSFSSVYAGYQNPFAGKKNIWLKFLLHLGIDAVGTTAAATEGYQKSFRFNTCTFAFLLLHRLITLPSMVVDTDLYNRSLKAGYQIRF